MYEELLKKIKDRTAIIAVIGLGYVGLPTAVRFAEQGFTVIGADKNQKIVHLITSGECHLNDLNIAERVKNVVDSGKLFATENTTYATKRADIILIIVPTPVHSDKTPDLRPIILAGEDIAKGLSVGKLVVLESTVYPGLTEEILKPILEKGTGRPIFEAGIDFGLAHVPERYNPGDSEHTIQDVIRVVGAINPDWLNVVSMLYRTIVKDVCEVRNIKTAEAAKIIENIQRDLNIALMNELAMIFEKMDIDVMDVIKAAQTKWNFNVYYPGAGVGGECLPCDPYYLTHKAEELGIHSKVILAGRGVNDSMPYHVLDLLIDALNEHERSIKNSKIVVMGLAYKENVGDVKGSPSAVLIIELENRGADIWILDPYVESTNTPPENEMYEIMKGADAIVIMTAHKEFKELSFTKIQEGMRTPILIDGRRMIRPDIAKELEFTYRGVGARNGGTKNVEHNKR